MFRLATNLFTTMTSRNLYYKDVKKISKRTDYTDYSKVYDNERSAAGSDVICAFLQFYTGIKLQHMKVLDAGGGTGTITKALIEHGVGNVSLVDASSDMLEVAKEKLADDLKSGTVGGIMHHFIPPIPFPDSSFDAVMFNLCIYTEGTTYHSEQVQTLKEAHRVLKPEGVVLISAIERSTAKNMWATKLDKAIGERYLLKLPSLQCYDKMFYEAGLSCTQKVSLLGSDIWPNYFRDPSSYMNNAFLYFLSATHDERQRVNQAIEELKQKGELQQWVEEHDKTTGLLTIFVCKANADCPNYEV